MYASPNNFENIVDRCIFYMQESGKTVEDCLEQFPGEREQLAPLLPIVKRLQDAKSMRVPEDFRQSAWMRMNNLIEKRAEELNRSYGRINDKKSNRTTLNFVWLPRQFVWGTVIIVLIFLFVLSSSVVYASNSALPGERFYSTKLAVEEIQLALSVVDSQDIRLHLRFANRRIDEISHVTSEKQLPEMSRGLANYADQVNAAIKILVMRNKGFFKDQSDLASFVVNSLTQDENRLNLLLAYAPESSQPVILSALDAARSGRAQVMGLIGGLPDSPGGLPGVLENSPTIQAEATPTPPVVSTLNSGASATLFALPSTLPTTFSRMTPTSPGSFTTTPPGWGWGTRTPPVSGTGWPTYYPTEIATYSKEWSTVYPTPRGTPRPPLRPTRTSVPLAWGSP